MMKRLTLVLLVMVVFSLVTVNTPSRAQDAKEIAYGDTAPGEFTAEVRSVSYQFTGSKGDIAVVQMLPDVDKAVYGANVKIEDKNNKAIADSSELIIFGQTGEMVGAEIPADGTYTITVSLGKTSDDVGLFEVTLLKAEELEVGKAVSGEAQSAVKGKRAGYSAVYTFSSKDNVAVNYVKDKGDYTPSVIVFAVEGGNNLYPLNYMGGRGLNVGTLGVDGDRNFRIVAVGPLGFGDLGSGDSANSASFTLTLEAAK
jgi:hypothetical protein